ncbi:uncharacterized protein LOC108115416 [Drosophila eugracilis]|uniref:uncharacterized protein LOC108115416 n=1 Tax=Drosophila eugracilis TaxID=29029 RepID=UPI001BD913CB|nr:uncharacterized protein LOC108115416 [Drosophila eugracilis]
MFGILLFLAVDFGSVWATDYYLLIEDPEVYMPCSNGPPGSISISEAFDMDNMIFEMEEDGIHISGNATVNWSVPRTDRISASFKIMHFNRGSWEPTIISQLTWDFCAVFYDKNQYWYTYWYQHVENLEEFKQKCIATKGTVMVMKPFIMQLRLNNVNGGTFRGRYKAVFLFEVFDHMNRKRPQSLCFEIKGDIEKAT